MNSIGEEICCPRFDPLIWDDKQVEWNNKPFIKDTVATFFYVPLNYGAVMRRLDQKLAAAKGVFLDNLCLSNHRSKWKMDLFMAVDRAIPGADNVSKSGTYYCKVYEGNFRDTGKWMKDFEERLKSKGLKGSPVLTWYTTCPKCARKYGKNYVVLLSEL